MIQANELRIGNLILTRKLNALNHPIGEFIEMAMPAERFSHIAIYPDQYKGIQLTAEWLLKFGFEKQGGKDGYIWTNGRFELGYSSNHKFNVFMQYGIDKKGLIYIDHVHPLQNLYFALTGDELEIKQLVK